MIATARRAAPPTGSYDRAEPFRDAVCRQPGADPEWWTSDHLPTLAKGAAACRRCPAFDACERRQTADPQPGVYAGVLWTRATERGPCFVGFRQPARTMAPKPPPRTCEVCAKKLRANQARYCSQVCYNSTRMAGHTSPHQVNLTCLVCPATFLGYHGRKYCSPPCRRIGYRAARITVDEQARRRIRERARAYAAAVYPDPT